MGEKACALALMFFVYAFLGWCCEVAYAACKQGRFINRGFLNGPVCPIYGFGALGVVYALAPVRGNLALLFVGGVALSSAIEFFTGLALEKLFHARWWNYSNRRFNLRGYVCLSFSLLWGAGCALVVLWLHPLVEGTVRALPFTVCAVLDILMLLVFAVDGVATVISVRKLSRRLMKLTLLGDELHALSDELGRTIAGGTLAARTYVSKGGETLSGKRQQLQQQLESTEKQLAAWVGQQRVQTGERVDAVRARFDSLRRRILGAMPRRVFGERRLLSAFPNLTSERYQAAVESLRAFYRRRVRGDKE